MSHYLPLYGILIFGGIGIIYFDYDPAFQSSIIAATTVAYFTWGIIHHKIHHDLGVRIILEYLGVSLLGMVILTSVLS